MALIIVLLALTGLFVMAWPALFIAFALVEYRRMQPLVTPTPRGETKGRESDHIRSTPRRLAPMGVLPALRRTLDAPYRERAMTAPFANNRLRILIWHIHGSYLDSITSVEHDWYLPVKDGPDGYGGRRVSSPPWVHDVPYRQVRDLDLDLVIFQTPRNLEVDQWETLSEQQRTLPRIYLEHNVPRPHAVDTRHPVDDPRTLLVHVTHYNRLMWDNGSTPTAVVEHSVAIDRSVRYTGALNRGITVINGIGKRPRIAGYDLFLRAREEVPLDIAGIDAEEIGGLGDIPYRYLHARMADYRLLFSPIRYTSLPLAVIEAMTIGMPVVALATTELPTVIENGLTGYLSCELDDLVERMRYLLAHPEVARRLGENARRVAESRFGLDRFARDWNLAFTRAIELQASTRDA